MSKLTFTLSLFALATLPFALGCSSSTCTAIPDGVYTVIEPDSGATVALVVPALSDAAATDGATAIDAARDGATHDAAARDAASHDAAARDAATALDAGRDAATIHDAATAHDAAIARDAATVRDGGTAHDAAATVDAETPVDAGTTADAGPTGPGTYTFHNGLPVPYDTWVCTKPSLTCEMTYICEKPGEQSVSIVTSYTTGAHPSLAFIVTPPGTVIHLQPPPQ